MKKSTLRRLTNRMLHILARQVPGACTLRPFLHRLRGIHIGKDVFIGDDVYLDNEYPEAIEIDAGAQLSVRVVVIAHTRGPGKVRIGSHAYLGPNVVVTCPEGRSVMIGEGAVIGAGVVVTRDVPPRVVLMNEQPRAVAKANISLSEAATFEEFVRRLEPVRTKREPGRSEIGGHDGSNHTEIG